MREIKPAMSDTAARQGGLLPTLPPGHPSGWVLGKWKRGARRTHWGALPASVFVGESAGARLRALGRSARAGGEVTQGSERIVFSVKRG